MKKEMILTHFTGHFQEFYRPHIQALKAGSNGQWQGLCPFHQDHNPSFSCNSQNGLWKCFGCGKGGDCFAFWADLKGLNHRSDFKRIVTEIGEFYGIPDGGRAGADSAKATAPILRPLSPAALDWMRANGKAYSQESLSRFKLQETTWHNECAIVIPAEGGVIRLYLWKRPKKEDRWESSPTGAGATIVKGDLTEKEILVAEGEWDLFYLYDQGFKSALTGTTGAGSFPKKYLSIFEGKTVFIAYDNDAAGRTGAEKLAREILGACKGASVKIADIPAGSWDGKDISDFFNAGNSAETFQEVLREAKAFQPRQSETKGEKPKAIADIIIESRDFINLDLPQKKTFLHPWLTEQSIVLITGWRGVGKTWLAMSILDAITKGTSFGPWEGAEAIPSLYLDGEMAAADIKARLSELNSDQKGEPLYIYSDAYANLQGLPGANLLNPKWRQAMKDFLTQRAIKIWVIDNVSSLCAGAEENSKKEWDPVNKWLLDLRFAGISTILLHHTNKEGDQRGTSAREDNIDISISLKKPWDYIPEDGARFIMSFSKARVRTAELSLIADTEFKLTQDASGKAIWTYGNVKKQVKVEALRMIGEDVRQEEIAAALGISKGRVSQLKRELTREGFLTKKGTLTPAGERYMETFSATK